MSDLALVEDAVFNPRRVSFTLEVFDNFNLCFEYSLVIIEYLWKNLPFHLTTEEMVVSRDKGGLRWLTKRKVCGELDMW